MKIAVIGASHWHLSLYLEPLLKLEGVTLIGLSDPDPAVSARLAGAYGCVGESDFRRLCEMVRPDFVFVLGRHVDMPEMARWLIEAGFPFALEKPCGIRADDVAALADLARTHNAFAAVSLVFRNGELLKLLRELDDGKSYQVMSFRFIAGVPERYRQAGCDWMLDPAQSGGGCTSNLSIHFFDLARLILGDDLRVTSAAMSNAAFGNAVEDHSSVTLKSAAGSCLIETGYLYPAPTSNFDLHYSIRSPDRYIVVHGWDDLEILDCEGHSVRRKVSSTNVPHYADFVRDVLERVQRGATPLAGLDDVVPSLRLIETAYGQVRAVTGESFNAAIEGAATLQGRRYQ